MNKYRQYPDEGGRFGEYGGRFVAETLMLALEQLEAIYTKYSQSSNFIAEFDRDLQHFVGRPSPLYFAQRLTDYASGANIYLKREDLNHTGSHKINNCVGQALLAKLSGKTKIIAETGAGQHGVAAATIAARLGLECTVFMGEKDIERQTMNVYRMKLLGAKVVSVSSGTKTLKDALNEALRHWITHVDDTFYIIGSVTGPHPYPQLVRDFQSIIGREVKQQTSIYFPKLPDALVACVGGGSNAIGLFYAYLEDETVAMYGVEAGGMGLKTGLHAAPLSSRSTKGVLHGNKTYVMSDENGQILPTHSISAGLDYPGVGPEHSWLKDLDRVNYVAINDDKALDAFRLTTQLEGILPALESSHAVAYALDLAKTFRRDQNIVVCLSGRGDKDIHTVAELDSITLKDKQ